MPQLSLRQVLGFPVHVADGTDSPAKGDRFAPYLDWLSDRIEAGQFTHVVTVNAEMVMLARKDAEFARVLRQADLLPPDGAGIVLALRWQGTKIRRCPGIELAERAIELAADRSWPVAVVGGRAEVLELVLRRWRERFPRLQVAGHHGYFDERSEAEIASLFAQLKPQLVLVGLGAPRQEYWIRDRKSLAATATWVGIGGSLDIWAGAKQRAPQWLRDLHLEWLYRLYKEPWRWRRMLALPRFAWNVLVNGGVTK